jgi:hypothetical protein
MTSAPWRGDRKAWRLRAWVRSSGIALSAFAVLALCACGGGGVPVPVPVPIPSGQVDGSVSATFEPEKVAATIVEGEVASPRHRFRADLRYTGNRNIYLAMKSLDGLARNYGMVINGNSFDADLEFNVAYSAGTQHGELLVLVCFDPDCREAVPGSPLRVPLQLEVLPNIHLAPETTLSRTGREPAPTLDIPVSVPAAAGEIVMEGGNSVRGVNVQWLGQALRVTTEQLSAGRYEQDVVLTSRSDPRYRAAARIVYRVDPPQGGQLPLSLTPFGGNAVVVQGQTHRQRLHVQRPTWTDALQPLVLTDASGRARLESLGGDDYDLVFDATGVDVGSVFTPQLSISAPPWGGEATATFRLSVAGAFAVNLPGVMLDGKSTLDSLSTSANVTTASGPAARWSARSLSPWIRLRSTSGTTGVDALTVDFDAAAVLAHRGQLEGEVEVATDQSAASPLRVSVVVVNQIPAVGPSFSDALLAGNGSVYLDGTLDFYSDVTRTLQVEGAVLQGATIRSDPRFAASLNVMRVDLQGLTVGQTVILRSAWPLLTTEVKIPVLDTPRVPSGQVSLPFGRWRSAQYSLRQGALYFAGDGFVGRWALAGGVWSLQTVAVPGLVDAALYGDHTSLLAAGGQSTWRLDAGSLATMASSSLASRPFYENLGLEATPPTAMSALAVAADGASVAATRALTNAGSSIAMMTVGGQFADLTGSTANGTEPGNVSMPGDPDSAKPGVGLVRSASGEIVVGVYPSGQLRVYRASQRMPEFNGQVLPGRTPRAVSNDGSKLLLDDGSSRINGTTVAGSLSALLPAGFTIGGYGLSGNGRFGLIYLYRVAIEGGLPRARDAAVWTVDLASAETRGLDGATPVVDRRALADAVGCNATLQAAESCAHEAQIVVAPGDASAFVLGPRGVAAFALPATVSSTGNGVTQRRPNIITR